MKKVLFSMVMTFMAAFAVNTVVAQEVGADGPKIEFKKIHTITVISSMLQMVHVHLNSKIQETLL